jgi:hypothetical protein
VELITWFIELLSLFLLSFTAPSREQFGMGEKQKNHFLSIERVLIINYASTSNGIEKHKLLSLFFGKTTPSLLRVVCDLY